MYRMQRQGWFRYLEFILLDSLILSLIFGFSYAVYNKVPFFPPSRDVAGLAILILLFIFSESIMLKVHNNLQGRDTLKEFFVCLIDSNSILNKICHRLFPLFPLHRSNAEGPTVHRPVKFLFPQ